MADYEDTLAVRRPKGDRFLPDDIPPGSRARSRNSRAAKRQDRRRDVAGTPGCIVRKMQPVVPRLLAVCLCVAVPIGALCAPLVHAHVDDHHAGHHDANRVHAHLSGHDVDRHVSSGGDLAIGPDVDPEHITRLQIFVAIHAAAPLSVALAHARYTLPTPLESIMRRPPAVVHSHGPPGASFAGSRAPPAFPS